MLLLSSQRSRLAFSHRPSSLKVFHKHIGYLLLNILESLRGGHSLLLHLVNKSYLLHMFRIGLLSVQKTFHLVCFLFYLFDSRLASSKNVLLYFRLHAPVLIIQHSYLWWSSGCHILLLRWQSDNDLTKNKLLGSVKSLMRPLYDTTVKVLWRFSPPFMKRSHSQRSRESSALTEIVNGISTKKAKQLYMSFVFVAVQL